MIDGVRRIKHVRVVVGKYSGTWWYRGLVGIFVLTLTFGIFSQVDFTKAVTGTLTQTTWTGETSSVQALTVPGSESFSFYASGQDLQKIDISTPGEVKLAKELGKKTTHTNFAGIYADFGTPATTAHITSGNGIPVLVPQLTPGANLQAEKQLFDFVPGDPTFGKNVDIAFDENNYPHIIFDKNGKLMYAYFVGTGGGGTCQESFADAWKCEEVVTTNVGSANISRDVASITIDKHGTVFIAVMIDKEVEILARGSNMSGLNSGRYTTSCSRSGVTIASGWYCPSNASVGQDMDGGLGIAVDSSSNPYVTFTKGNKIYVYNINNSGDWTGTLFSTTSSNNAFARAAIVIEKNSSNVDQLHLAFFNANAAGNPGQKIFHAQIPLGSAPSTIQNCEFYESACASAGFRSANSGSNPRYINIAVVPGTDEVHLVYNRATSDDVYYTNNRNGVWNNHRLLGASELATETAPRIVEIGVGISGKPYLSAQNNTTKGIKVCRMTTENGDSCSAMSWESAALGNKYEDMAFAVSGNDIPALVYTESSSGDGIKFATTNFQSGATYTNDFGPIGYSGVLQSNDASLTMMGTGSAVASINVGSAVAGVSLPYSVTFSPIPDSYLPPVVTSVTFTYDAYFNDGTLYSPIFDTTANYSILSSIAGDETSIDGGSDLEFFMRSGATSPTGSVATESSLGGTWTEWCGQNDADGCDTANGFNFGEGLPGDLTDGVNNRYFQYKIVFSNSIGTAILKDITINFAVNDDPEIFGVIASQQFADTDNEGKVVIDYNLTDPDVGSQNAHIYPFYDTGVTLTSITDSEVFVTGSINTFPSAGTIIINRELMTYTGKSSGKFTGVTRATLTSTSGSHASGDIVWAPASSATGHVGTSPVISEDNGKRIIWDAKSDIATYDQNMQVRIVAIDYNELGNTISAESGSVSAAFTLDTGNPTIGSITVTDGSANTGRTNSTAVTVNLNEASDNAGNSGLKMKITGSGISDGDTDWTDYSPSATKTLTNGDGIKSISVQLRDAYGNKSAISNGSITLDTTAPSTPVNFQRQAVCLTSTDQDQAFLTWGMPSEANHVNFAGFEIDYDSGSSDGTFQADIKIPATDQTAETAHQTNITAGSYVFAIRTYDTLNNYSTPTAFGSSLILSANCTVDGDAPEITHDSVADVDNSDTDTATITWSTNENADTYIDFQTTAGVVASSNKITQGRTELVTSHSYTLTGLLPGTTYYYVLRSKDGSGNEKVSAEFNFTTSASSDTTPPTLSNINVITKSDSVIITWDTSEVADSFVQNSGSNLSFSSDSLVTAHSVEISGLSPGTTYTATLISNDASGNQGTASKTYTTLGTSVIVPEIDEATITVINIDAYSATIQWEVTNEAADSFVKYAVFEQGLSGAPTFTHFAGSSTLIPIPGSGNAIHQVKLLGLSPETQYQYRVSSTNAGGNTTIYPLGSAVNSFVTSVEDTPLNAPIISNISTGDDIAVDASTATISWTTNQAANSWIDFSAGSAVFDKSQGTNSITDTINGTATHQRTLIGLTPGTQYLFRVRSENQSGIESDDDNNGNGYTFTTTAAPESTIDVLEESITVTNIGTNSATINWNTNVAGNSKVHFWATDQVVIIEDTAQTTSHSIILSNLKSHAIYNYYVMSTDSNGVTAVNHDALQSLQFSTLATGPEDDVDAPVITGGAVPTIITTDSAVISFITDEPATAYVEIDINTLFSEDSFDYQKFALADFGLSHTITLDFLDSEQEYVYRISASDKSSNTSFAPETEGYSFITLSEDSAVQQGNGEENIDPDVPPEILSLTIKDVGGSVATILWETNKPATRAVEYGVTSGNYPGLKQGTSALSLVHNVKLVGLSLNTKYYFTVKSVDAFGNIGESEELSFTTNAEIDDSELLEALQNELDTEATDQQISILELLTELSDSAQSLVEEFLDAVALLAEDEQDKILEIISADLIGPPRILGARPNVKLTDTSAVIEWESTKETTSQVAFATDANYAPGEDQVYSARAGSDTEYTTQHRVELKDLTPFTIYHYQLIGTERSGRKNLSVDRTFETLRVQPKFNRVSLTSVTEQSVTVFWRTNVDTTGEVLVRNRETGDGRTIESLTPGTEHEVTLRGLESENKYNLFVTANTKGGASIRSNIIPFSTDPDDSAPEIQQVRTKLTIAPGKGNDVQAIISWVTDEPSNAQVFFDEGIGKDGELRQASPINGDLSFTHVVVLTKLRPATIYTFRAASTDISGNVGESREFKIFTPRKEESVLELIIGNFEDTFGFIKNR